MSGQKYLALFMIVLNLLSSACAAGQAPTAIPVLQSDVSRETASDVALSEMDELVLGNNDFAFDLFHAVAGQEGNLFFSPYSIWIALAMTYAGARGETAAQMAETLHYTLPQPQLHPAANALDLRLMASDNEGQFNLTVANALWGQQEMAFRQEYLNIIASYYGAGLHLVDFQSEVGREAAGRRINQWVSDATGEKITDLVDPSLFTELTRLVLTNAITFDGFWQQPFDGGTKKADFTLLDASSVQVPLMQRYATITPYAAGEGWQATEIAYQGGRTHMLILLPADGHFQTFASELDAGRLEEIEAALAPTDLALFLPRFNYAADLALSETLADMGMPMALSASEADFTGMAEIPARLRLFISRVLHRAYVAVDELGTEAAGATEIEMMITGEPSVPEVIRVDRPFLFLIRDAEQGTILFLGRVVNPAAS